MDIAAQAAEILNSFRNTMMHGTYILFTDCKFISEYVACFSNSDKAVYDPVRKVIEYSNISGFTSRLYITNDIEFIFGRELRGCWINYLFKTSEWDRDMITARIK